MKQATVLLLTASFLSSSAWGTMSTDDTRASQAEASLSGIRKNALEDMEKQEERKELRKPMTMEDASSVEFDPDDPGVYETGPEQTEQ